ncbi:polysaccharide biosynthesis tyrosine autokinase [Thermodesulfobacteriota bacterium]
MEKNLNALLITSSLQGEGKTTTVFNLAFTIAQTGKSVLMVDMDLRKPGLSQRFSLEKATGFSNIVSDVLGDHVSSGKVSDYGLNDLIELISLQIRSCVLNISDKKNEAELYFLKGDLVDVHWKNRPESEKLANILIKENLITKENARMSLEYQEKSARRLGWILVSLGLVEEKDIKKILSTQVMAAFKVASEMTSATFSIRPVTENEIRLSTLGTVKFSELSKELFISNKPGTFIAKNIESKILETEEKNLSLLPSGSIPPNPSELIGSSRTSYLIEFLKSKFDVVIIDSPPIIPASDAILLSLHVDGVVFVVQVGTTSHVLTKKACQQLENANAPILGVILNKANVKNSQYYKYYQSYYDD